MHLRSMTGETGGLTAVVQVSDISSISICIASVGRVSLRKTLQSLASCHLAGGTVINVVIADDSETGAVREILESDDCWPFNIKVVKSASQNIAVARNACLANANGEYLAFIDDDEWAHEQWLWNLLRQARATGADAIFGPVEAVFPTSAPDWIRRAQPFGRRAGQHGTRVRTGATGNAFLRRASVERLQLRFREEFGRSGGEDTDFFSRLHAEGALMLASEDAVVYECVPSERLRLSHLQHRHSRGGQTYAITTLRRASILVRAGFYIGALVKFLFCAFCAALTWPFRKDVALRFALKMWLNEGKLREAFGLPLVRLY